MVMYVPQKYGPLRSFSEVIHLIDVFSHFVNVLESALFEHAFNYMCLN